jgi:hypothetical protein
MSSIKTVLGAFTKLRLLVRPSVRMELGTHWTDFHEILYLITFQKSVEKIQVSLKSDKITGTLHEELCTYMTTSR